MSYRILVVDQDPAGAERIQRPLAEAGYDVVVSSDAGEAMSTFEKVRPDLAVIEALLPEKPGPVLCREIKESPAGKGTPVVLLLESDEDRQARARSLDLHGCDLLIERSIEGSELIELLEQLLRPRLAQAEVAEDRPAEDASRPARAPAEAASGGTTAGTGRDSSGKLIDSEGVVDALSRLDAIIDEHREPQDLEGAAAEATEVGAPGENEKVKKAERAGDFSFLREEVAEKKQAAPQRTALAAAAEAPEEAPVYVADSGQDIADHIDALFAATSPGEPTPAEKQVLSWTFDNGETEKAKERATPRAVTGEAPAKPAGAPQRVERAEAAPVAAPPAPPAVERPAEPPARKPVAGPARPPARTAATAMQTATFAGPAARRVEKTRPPAEGGSRWWVVAACLSVVLIGGGLAILFLGGKGAMPDRAQPAVRTSPLVASTASGVEPVPAGETDVVPETGETAESQAAAPSPEPPVPAPQGPSARATAAPASGPGAPPAAAEPARKPRAETATPPVRETRTTAVEQRPAAAAPRPRPAAPKTAAPEASAPRQKAPSPETPARATAPPPAVRDTRTTTEGAAPAPSRAAEAAPPRVESAPRPAPPAAEAPPSVTRETATPGQAPAESAERTALQPPASEQGPVASAPPPAPSEPAVRPPELVERSEPDYPPKTLKRASGERIVLKLLISDNGRIARVLVERGTRFKDLEAAAVSAVLRWRFRPATENGVPVEAWTTAEFTF